MMILYSALASILTLGREQMVRKICDMRLSTTELLFRRGMWSIHCNSIQRDEKRKTHTHTQTPASIKRQLYFEAVMKEGPLCH